MVIDGKSLHRVTQRFNLSGKIADHFVARYLARKAQLHVADGLPPLAGFAFDYIAREVHLRGQFEREELTILAEFLSPMAARFADSTALDIGANIGNHSLFFAQKFKSVHSFEPNPRTFGALALNSRLVDNITPHNLALGTQKGVLTLAFNPLNVGEASLVETYGDAKLDHVDVSVETLDSMLSDLGHVSFIKIDVEGFEPQVLRGASDLLASQHPIIAFEQNPSAFVDGQSATVNILQALGYRLCVMAKRNVGHGLIGQTRSIIGKIIHGIEYDLVLTDHITPGHYPMIVAVTPDDLQLLTRSAR